MSERCEHCDFVTEGLELVDDRLWGPIWLCPTCTDNEMLTREELRRAS